MLRALKETEYRDYLDWAYSLALDMSRSGYPTYADGLKRKSDFEEHAARVFRREHEEILLFEENAKPLGWLQYYALPQDKYLQTCAFCTEDGTERAMDELIAYLAQKYPGFTLYMGFSGQNTRAVNHLKELGWPLDDECLVGVLRFEDYSPRPETAELIPITGENFHRFAALHAHMDGKMYWDNAHLREALDQWHICVYCRDGRDLASVYFVYRDNMMEIFGMDYVENRFDREAFRAMLVRALNQAKAEGMETFTYFHDTDEAPTVRELGIRSLGTYVLYAKEL